MRFVRLGDAPLPPPTSGVRIMEAGAVLVSGAMSATALVLYARGHTKEAAALGAAGLIVGTIVAAARTLEG